MTEGYQALTEKEKATLRLLARGHDAKSAASAFGLSVHTINERLRDARRKLGTTSSREAARLLIEAERADPEKSGDTDFGDADDAKAGQKARQAEHRRGGGWLTGVIIAMSALFAVLLILAPPAGETLSTPSAPVPAAIAAADAEAERAARDWLALTDARDWRASYAATGTAFRKLNSLARWTEVASQVHSDYGPAQQRTLVSVRDIAAPPMGYREVVFRSTLANGRTVHETVTLERQDGALRVVGCMIE